MLVQNNRTSIEKLSVTSDVRDSLHLQLEIGRLFSSADLHPTNLPANAIVCINQFRTPLHQQPSQFRDPGWEQTVRRSLNDIVSRAERPINGLICGAVNAVIFADMAELLACLARDWSNGSIKANWWWRALLREERSVWAFWRRHAEYIPSALAHLARQKAVVGVLNGLTSEETRDLARLVVDRFSLYRLAPFLNAPIQEDESQQLEQEGVPTRPIHSVPRSKPRLLQTHAHAPWRNTLAGFDTAQLGVEQERFLGICMLLQREPSRVRTERFAREVEQWQGTVTRLLALAATPQPQVKPDPRLKPTPQAMTYSPEGECGPSITPDDSVESIDQIDVREGKMIASNEFSGPTEIKADSSTTTQQPVDQPSAGTVRLLNLHGETQEPSSPIEQLPHFPAGRANAGSSRTNSIEFEQEVVSPPIEIQSSLSDDTQSIGSGSFLYEDTPEVPAAPVEESELVSAVEIFTQLGGLFYLINLGLYLNFYGDFTTPDKPGIQLNIWDFVSLVGADLVGPQRSDDQVWTLLATLAGRDEDVPPGAEFFPENEWRMCADWLSAFRSGLPWRWTVQEQRLLLFHPEGFLVVDVPCEQADPVAHLQRESEAYSRFISGFEDAASRTNDCPPRSHIWHPLNVWLARLMPYVRARLKQSFGIAEQSQVGQVLCQHAARVRVTESHVDVFFALADLPVEIRLSGLDRDPGWVPAAGRFVAFHYE